MTYRRNDTRRRLVRWLTIGGGAAVLLTAAILVLVIKPWQGKETSPAESPTETITSLAAAPAADSCEVKGVEYVLIDGVAYDPQTSTPVECVPAPQAGQAAPGGNLEGLLAEGEPVEAVEASPADEAGEAGTLEDLLKQIEEEPAAGQSGTEPEEADEPSEKSGPSAFWRWGWAIPLGVGLALLGAGLFLLRRYAAPRYGRSRGRGGGPRTNI